MQSDAMMIGDEETSSLKAHHNPLPLEPFLLLAKGTHGAACADLIRTVLEAPGVYVFSELLQHPHVIELKDTAHANYVNTLNLFAYGTYTEYLQQKDSLIELSAVMIKKLKHLTIITMAINSKCLAYSDLMAALDIKCVRELEDLVIASIYADMIHGKLDQKNKLLEIDYTIGRDVRLEDIAKISSTLQDWCDSCETVLKTMETQIERANTAKMLHQKHNELIDLEIAALKKSVKPHLNEMEDEYSMDYKESTSSTTQPDSRVKKNKKLMKSSGGKPWFKF